VRRDIAAYKRCESNEALLGSAPERRRQQGVPSHEQHLLVPQNLQKLPSQASDMCMCTPAALGTGWLRRLPAGLLDGAVNGRFAAAGAMPPTGSALPGAWAVRGACIRNCCRLSPDTRATMSEHCSCLYLAAHGTNTCCRYPFTAK